MGTVFLCFLGHKANVWYRTECCRVYGTVGFHIVDDRFVETGISAVRNNTNGIFFVAVFVPHFSTAAYQSRHGRIHNNIGGDMEIGDTLVGVHHGNPRSIVYRSVYIRFYFCFVRCSFNFFVQGGQTVVCIDVQGIKSRFMFCKDIFEIGFYNGSEDDRVRNLHHRGLQVRGQKYIFFRSLTDGFFSKRFQSLYIECRTVNHFTGF